MNTARSAAIATSPGSCSNDFMRTFGARIRPGGSGDGVRRRFFVRDIGSGYRRPSAPTVAMSAHARCRADVLVAVAPTRRRLRRQLALARRLSAVPPRRQRPAAAEAVVDRAVAQVAPEQLDARLLDLRVHEDGRDVIVGGECGDGQALGRDAAQGLSRAVAGVFGQELRVGEARARFARQAAHVVAGRRELKGPGVAAAGYGGSVTQLCNHEPIDHSMEREPRHAATGYAGPRAPRRRGASRLIPRPPRDLPSWLVRSLLVLILAATIATGTLTPVPRALPLVALESVVVYRLEVGCATALLSTLLVALFARGLVLGRLPATIGRDGVGWAETDE